MPLELRNKLLALSSTAQWHNVIWELWMQSTRVEVVSMQAATDNMLEKRFPLGHTYAATMDELGTKGGIYVTLEGGQRALARNSDIGPRGIRDPQIIFEQGQAVDVRILDISGGERGKPFISVAIPAPPSPQEIARKRLPLKSSLAATVSIVNDKYGVFLQLEGGQSALARKERIGPEGVIFPSRYFYRGGRFTVEIDNISETSAGEPMVYVTMPSAKVPSRIDQVRERFPVGSVVATEVDRVDDERGVFVALEGGLQAWVHKSDIGPEGMMIPQLYYRQNQPVNIRILEVSKDDLGGVQIIGAIPAGPSRLQQARYHFREGSTFSGQVKEVRDDVGVLVTLSADQDAKAISRAIGPEGVIIASKYFKVGQQVQMVIRSVQQDDAGAVTIDVAIPAPFVPSRFEQLRDLFPIEALTWGSIKTIKEDFGLFVRVDAAQGTMVPDVFVHWSKIGLEGVIDLRVHFSPEQRVEVHIREVIRDENGRIRMVASIPHPPFSVPSMIEQLLDLYPVGKTVTCKVENVLDDLGVFVKLRGNVNALVHKSKIGPRGVGTPSQYFTKDQWVAIRIISEAYPDKAGKIRIQASIPSIT
jgi:ribosomal protein S1/cold shock CspA family protein